VSSGFDEERVIGALSEFARTLAGRFETSEVLYRLAEQALDIFAVAGAGVSVRDAQGRLRPVTGINELTTGLEAAQERFQQGPCVDAFRDDRNVVVDDLAAVGDRWPQWNREARRHQVQAVLGVPLRVREESLGALDLYSAHPRQWRESDIRLARVLCDMTASYLANASDLLDSQRTSEQLRGALASRVVIEQAKGIIAAELQCSVDEAFAVLRAHSRAHGANLRSVADAVVRLGLRPAPDPASPAVRDGRPAPHPGQESPPGG
jgi:GAF domain-containing protein